MDLDKLSQKQLLKIWQEGLTLEDAIWEYADDELHDAYPEPPTIDDRDKIKDVPLNEMFSDAIIGLSKYQCALTAYNEERKLVIQAMQSDVFEKLKRGKLMGLGYKMPIISDYPEIIPFHMWPPQKFNEEESLISAHGFDFINVHILEKSFIEKLFQNVKITSVPDVYVNDKKVGRPSTKEALIKAYESLNKEQKIEFSTSLKAHTERINNTLISIGESPVSYKAISKHLGKKFKEDKNLQTRP